MVIRRPVIRKNKNKYHEKGFFWKFEVFTLPLFYWHFYYLLQDTKSILLLKPEVFPGNK